ncbi:uncharacterized protein LOC131657242 [Vicia villosa]|uniref:uncharacterized protein LOC131657242 n=1 Tax=Vicia villosa TaxID=3911 RepID=UPI00273B7F42|nr:uncharacterized protein LOC131657242 [Vicia villosa]
MYLKSMEELQQDQELLRAEVSQLKIQMDQIMETLQVLLKRECNFPPIITKQVDTHLAFSVATSNQGQPSVMSCDSYFGVEKETPVCFPQSVLRRTLHQRPLSVPSQGNKKQKQDRNRDRTHFDPIPMSYTELYPTLVRKGLITTRAMPPPRNPPSIGFRPDLHCEFHQGGAGHDLEHCYALKALVQELVRSKMLSFRDMGPNVVTNPLPDQSG